MTRKSNRKRITPRDIALAIKNDEEVVSAIFRFQLVFPKINSQAKLCADVTIPDSGVQPFIHQVNSVLDEFLNFDLIEISS